MLIVTSQPFAGLGKTVTPPRIPAPTTSSDPRAGAGLYPSGGSGYSTSGGSSSGDAGGDINVVYEDGSDGSSPSTSTMPGWVKPAAVASVLAIAGYFILRR